MSVLFNPTERETASWKSTARAMKSLIPSLIVHTARARLGSVGISLALENAATLAGRLRDQPDHTAAFALYQRLRQSRKPTQTHHVEPARDRGPRRDDAAVPAPSGGRHPRNDWLDNHTLTQVARAG